MEYKDITQISLADIQILGDYLQKRSMTAINFCSAVSKYRYITTYTM